MKTERVAIAYRLLFAYPFVRTGSEQNSSYSLSRVGFALAATRAARTSQGGARLAMSPRESRNSGIIGMPSWSCTIRTLSARRRRIDAELDEEVAVIIADPADNPELVLQKKNQAELVRHSLVRLSPEHGEVIDLVYYHGKSVREVAEIVGVARPR